MSVQELPKGIDPKVIRGMLDEAREQYDALERDWDSLVEEHEGQWVAAYHGKFVFGGSVQAVIEEAQKHGWPLGMIAIDQLRRERADILL